MDETKLTETLARIEEQLKTAFKRIEENRNLAESVHSLAISIERLTNAQESMKKELTTLTNDMEELKARPAKRWDSLIAALISAVIGVLVGMFLRK